MGSSPVTLFRLRAFLRRLASSGAWTGLYQAVHSTALAVIIRIVPFRALSMVISPLGTGGWLCLQPLVKKNGTAPALFAVDAGSGRCQPASKKRPAISPHRTQARFSTPHGIIASGRSV